MQVARFLTPDLSWGDLLDPVALARERPGEQDQRSRHEDQEQEDTDSDRQYGNQWMTPHRQER